MSNVDYEVGSMGSGLIAYKHLFFGWMFKNGYDGDEYLLEDIADGDPKLYRAIIDALPQTVAEEVRTYVDKELEKKQVEKEKAAEVLSWDCKATTGYPEGACSRMPLSDQIIHFTLNRWSRDNWSDEFTEFCEDILNSESPMDRCRELYQSNNHSGWVADIVGGWENDFIRPFN